MEVVYLLVGLVAAFLGLKFMKDRKDQKDIQKEVEHKVENARLKEKQKNREERLLALQKKMEDARKEGRDLSEEEIEDFWNND